MTDKNRMIYTFQETASMDSIQTPPTLHLEKVEKALQLGPLISYINTLKRKSSKNLLDSSNRLSLSGVNNVFNFHNFESSKIWMKDVLTMDSSEDEYGVQNEDDSLENNEMLKNRKYINSLLKEHSYHKKLSDKISTCHHTNNNDYGNDIKNISLQKMHENLFYSTSFLTNHSPENNEFEDGKFIRNPTNNIKSYTNTGESICKNKIFNGKKIKIEDVSPIVRTKEKKQEKKNKKEKDCVPEVKNGIKKEGKLIITLNKKLLHQQQNQQKPQLSTIINNSKNPNINLHHNSNNQQATNFPNHSSNIHPSDLELNEGVGEGEEGGRSGGERGRLRSKKTMSVEQSISRRKKLWQLICKKEIPRAYKQRGVMKKESANNMKKVLKEFQRELKRVELESQRRMKEESMKAKRLAREMMVLCKNKEKVEKEQRKKAEKEALEQRKIEMEQRELRRQNRKLNFLITQTELYAHFMAGKIHGNSGASKHDGHHHVTGKDDHHLKTEEAANSVHNILRNFDEERSMVYVDDYDAVEMKQQALSNVKDAIRQQQNTRQEFDLPVQASTSSSSSPTKNFFPKLTNTQSTNSDKTEEKKQPGIFQGTLKSYQLKGMNWLATLYDQGINGILADEMGLGKTVQTISFFAHLAEDQGIWGPFLIVAPASTLHNWQQEVTRFVPAFKVVPYWGTAQDRKILRKIWSTVSSRKNAININHKESAFHVVVTSYQLVVQDCKYFQQVNWHYMVLDEAQAIKSSSSSRWKSLLDFRCRNRLLLTGTPIQNSMAELWSLLHFIMPTLFDRHDEFKEWFSKDIENHVEKHSSIDAQQLSRLHMILKPFMLRRIKRDVENELSDKIEIQLSCPLTFRQKLLYKAIKERISIDDLHHPAAASTTPNTSSLSTFSTTNLMNIFMQLRKVCNHPELFERKEVRSPFFFNFPTYYLPTLIFKQGLLHSNSPKCSITHDLLNIFHPHHIHSSLFSSSSSSALSLSLSSFLSLKKSSPRMKSLSSSLTSLSSSPSPSSSCFSFTRFINMSPSELNTFFVGGLIERWCFYLQELQFHRISTCQHIFKSPTSISSSQPSLSPSPPTSSPSPLTSSPLSPSSSSLLSRHLRLLCIDMNVSISTSIQSSSSSLSLKPPTSSSSSPSLSSSPFSTLPVEFAFVAAINSVYTHATHHIYNYVNKNDHFVMKTICSTGSGVASGSGGGNSSGGSSSSCDNTISTEETNKLKNISLPSIKPYNQPDEDNTNHNNKRCHKDNDNTRNINASKPHHSYHLLPTHLPNFLTFYYDKVTSKGTNEHYTCDRRAEWARMHTIDKNVNRSQYNHLYYGCGVVGGGVVGGGVVGRVSQHMGGIKPLRIIKNNYSFINKDSSYYSKDTTSTNIITTTPATPIASTTTHHNIINTDPINNLNNSNNTLTTSINKDITPRYIATPILNYVDRSSVCGVGRSVGKYGGVGDGGLLASIPRPQGMSKIIIPSKESLVLDSGKLSVLDRLLKKLKKNNHRALIYSQMTKVIDLLEEFLWYRKHTYIRLDGSSKISDRRDMVADFQSRSDIFVFLLSTRAGGIGINLTAADTVIFYDSDWNPTVDQQAMDRAHRLGQTKQVTVYRLICDETIEERIMQRAKEKSEIQRMVISGSNTAPDVLKAKEVMSLLLADDQLNSQTPSNTYLPSNLDPTTLQNTNDTAFLNRKRPHKSNRGRPSKKSCLHVNITNNNVVIKNNNNNNTNTNTNNNIINNITNKSS